MAEVQRHPLLSREEERELAVRYREEGDREAAARLVTANLRLVVKFAYELRHAYRGLLDLIQEGNLGLLEAVQRYDPYRGVRFSSYASWWIRAYMLRYILDNFRLIRLGTTQAQRKIFYNLSQERRRLASMGFEPTPQLLAERLDVSEADLREVQARMAAPELSLNAPLSGEERDGGAFLDLVAAQGPAPEEDVARAQLREKLSGALAGFAEALDARERLIYERRLLSEEPLTLEEIGGQLGVTRERVRQIEKRLLEKARAYLRRRFGRDIELGLGDG
jgi:RNA polymerase sigma-32 factor